MYLSIKSVLIGKQRPGSFEAYFRRVLEQSSAARAWRLR
jgi:hypothetical protein